MVALDSGIWALKIIIIILTLGGSSDTILGYEPSLEIDRFNGYISVIIIGSYAYSLFANYRPFGIYLRAILFILLAFILFSFNIAWSCNRYLHGRSYSRLAVNAAMPIAFLVLLESVLTLKSESRKKRREELLQSCHEQEMRMATAIGGVGGGIAGSRGQYGIGAQFWPNRPLPHDEQDNVEVIIPVSLQYPPPSRMASVSGSVGGSVDGDRSSSEDGELGHGSRRKSGTYQRPAQAYFPSNSSSSTSSSSSAGIPAISSGQDHPADDQPPPYTRN